MGNLKSSVKQGTSFHLEVNFDGIDLDTVEFIEFAFSQTKDGIVKTPLKIAEWRNGNDNDDAARDDGTSIIRVGFTMEDTYRFKRATPFYMDTRIHIKDATDMPKTDIMEIVMNPTLFKEGM